MTPQEMRERIDELEQRVTLVERQRDRSDRSVDELMTGAASILGSGGFEASARAIFDYCCEMTGATSGYVALLSDDGQQNEVLFLEAGGLPCSVDPSLPMPIRGLRAEAYESKAAVYHNDFMPSSPPPATRSSVPDGTGGRSRA
jgi:GAF domain-containing protein